MRSTNFHLGGGGHSCAASDSVIPVSLEFTPSHPNHPHRPQSCCMSRQSTKPNHAFALTPPPSLAVVLIHPLLRSTRPPTPGLSIHHLQVHTGVQSSVVERIWVVEILVTFMCTNKLKVFINFININYLKLPTLLCYTSNIFVSCNFSVT